MFIFWHLNKTVYFFRRDELLPRSIRPHGQQTDLEAAGGRAGRDIPAGGDRSGFLHQHQRQQRAADDQHRDMLRPASWVHSAGKSYTFFSREQTK